MMTSKIHHSKTPNSFHFQSSPCVICHISAFSPCFSSFSDQVKGQIYLSGSNSFLFLPVTVHFLWIVFTHATSSFVEDISSCFKSFKCALHTKRDSPSFLLFSADSSKVIGMTYVLVTKSLKILFWIGSVLSCLL